MKIEGNITSITPDDLQSPKDGWVNINATFPLRNGGNGIQSVNGDFTLPCTIWQENGSPIVATIGNSTSCRIGDKVSIEIHSLMPQ